MAAASACQVELDQWLDQWCRPIRCRLSRSPNGVLRNHWQITFVPPPIRNSSDAGLPRLVMGSRQGVTNPGLHPVLAGRRAVVLPTRLENTSDSKRGTYPRCTTNIMLVEKAHQ